MKLFPSKFLSKPERFEFLTFRDEKTKEFFEKLTLDEYYKQFKKKSSKFDLHNLYFQNFSILSTSNLSGKQLRDLSTSRSPSKKRLLRARVYGISSQKEEWDWKGNSISEEEEEKKDEKEKKMNEISESFKLYDWANQPKDFELPKPRYERTRYRFYRMGTQECLLKIFLEYENVKKSKEEKEEEEEDGEEEEEEETPSNPKKIAWLNLANAHHVCGIYFSEIGGSQEEEVATNCTGCAYLGTCGEFNNSGPRSWVLGTGVHYKEGFHIPPGGNYFCKTIFLTGEPYPVESYMIASAFCDLRKRIPYVHSNTERGDYFDFWGNLIKKKKKEKEKTENDYYLEDRLYFDIEGCIRTAILESIDVIIAGASGCGAFKHDPEVEARIWNQVLLKYKGYFDQVVFAVLDKENSKNVTFFQKLFSGEEEEEEKQ